MKTIEQYQAELANERLKLEESKKLFKQQRGHNLSARTYKELAGDALVQRISEQNREVGRLDELVKTLEKEKEKAELLAEVKEKARTSPNVEVV